MKVYDDEDAWLACHDDDLWIFDKVILATKLGYVCGPKGVTVPEPGKYIVRPVMNLMGMGRGASIMHIENVTDFILPDGTFWCEIFSGRHLSVDYYKGQQKLCVEGTRSDDNLSRWSKWEKTDDEIPFPAILEELVGSYDWINVEFIGDKIIEIHLRQNPDFMQHDKEYIIPSYGETELEGHNFVSWPEHERIGFFIPEN